MIGAAAVSIALASSSTAKAGTPPDHAGCLVNPPTFGVSANGTIAGNISGSDCGSPPYLVSIYAQIQNDDTKKSVVRTVRFTNVTTIQNDIERGVTVSMPKEAGVHTYEIGGSITYHSVVGPRVLGPVGIHPIVVRI